MSRLYYTLIFWVCNYKSQIEEVRYLNIELLYLYFQEDYPLKHVSIIHSKLTIVQELNAKYQQV
jgi:hypothetical protein